MAAHQRMVRLVERELSADGVDPESYASLSLIGVRAPVTLTQIADELGLPLTTMSDIARRLEARGYLRRDANPDDRRSFLFELTARGDREWRRGWGALQRIQAVLKEELADEEETRAALTELGTVFAGALAVGL